ncbi:SusC/RagA family TonB-linked outer membrane protein [Mangrovibacterium lignilyticum]|uniref:SusC/RagA family TonB-linked outer membrane protein n=1 Tax=Mangrovibacterium lignilyticum TaxID=2668052 RepID=UPI0013D32C6C|nr:SusC/RagA family TonB-linked outer membrane protein [Mangrovibacterium lignilyticum]
MRHSKIALTILFVLLVFGLSAQNITVKGKVTAPDKQAVPSAVVTITGTDGVVQTDENGEFEVEVSDPEGTITISAEGFYSVSQPLSGREDVNVILIDLAKPKYNQDLVFPFRNLSMAAQTSVAKNIGAKDMDQVHTIENAMQGEVAGLRVTNKSGMPGEGSYLNLRGVRSLVSNNTPLILVNGVPYLPDTEESPIIGGYSRGIFAGLNVADIQNITVLKGAEASIYGSMGANGVILIETNGASQSDKLETQISLSSQFGVNWNDKRLPVMGGEEYKSYLTDIGLTYYDNMADLVENFPFLIDDPDYYYNYLYNNNTDWQDEIYAPSVVSNSILRVEGGDAVAKYDISLGYMNEGGVVDGTKRSRYNTQINTSININRKLELVASIGLAYLQADLQEQGLLPETNPVLVAYSKIPMLSPYKKDANGNVLAEYDTYRYGVSNPVAINKTLTAEDRQHNVNLRFGANYKLATDLLLSGTFGLYYNYDQEKIFIPGRSSATIVAMNNGLAENTVRSGAGEVKNLYYNVNANYKKLLDSGNLLNVYGGLQMLTSKKEYDAGSGYNTANDFYQTLAFVESGTTKFYGYINEWNWMNVYAHGDYTMNNLLRASVNVALDGTSASGVDASRLGVFPSGALTFMAKNMESLENSSFLNKLNIRAEYGLTGNSRFSSNYGKNYYQSTPFLVLSGIVRSSIPNTNLKWETTKQLDLGVDMALLRNRIDLGVNYFNAKSTDVLFAQPVSSVLGTSTYYDNSAEISNSGIEIELSAALLRTKDFEWIIGGNISTLTNEVKSLGNVDQSIMELPDGAEIITEVGANPYSFYGYKAEGVFASQAEAAAADLTDWRGINYEAGDVRYQDVNGDGLIGDGDKQVLGSATPDFFGGFNTYIRYKNFSVSAEFTYSSGNEAYNANRRTIEALDNFNNQSRAAVNRWQLDGQVTDIPKAVYGDPMNNNAFSSRWIEDASYLKLKYVTFAYDFDNTFLKFFRSGTVYVTGENLFTWTDYLGLDPEFSYSYEDALQGVDYSKVVIPRSVKFGFNLKF